MNQRNKNSFDNWADIAWYTNVLMFVFVIMLFIFGAVVSEIQLEKLAPYSMEDWEDILEKIMNLLFLIFILSLGILWVFAWKYLNNNWMSRSIKKNNFLILLIIFMPVVGAHYLYIEHKKISRGVRPSKVDNSSE